MRAGSLPRYLLQRLLLVIPMILVLLVMVFFMLRVAPGDPVTATLGDRLPPEVIAARQAQLGLDRPLLVQFFEYLGQVATFNFGESISDNQPILEVVRNNGGATLTLTVGAGCGRRSIPEGASIGRTASECPLLAPRLMANLHFLCFLPGTKNQLGAVEQPVNDVHAVLDSVVDHLRLLVRADNDQNWQLPVA